MKGLVLTVSLLFLVGCGSSNGTNDAQDSSFSVETITHNGLTYKTVKSAETAKIWLDRNLGAEQVCSSLSDRNCYGHYYQWGRETDGHQVITSEVTTVTSDKITGNNNQFIIGTSDWITIDSSGAQRSAYWYKSDGSSVCPVGFRVPTSQEMRNETIATGVNSREDAYNTFLKLPAAGYRDASDGELYAQDLGTLMWTSTVEATYPAFLNIGKDFAEMKSTEAASGLQIRCIKN